MILFSGCRLKIFIEYLAMNTDLLRTFLEVAKTRHFGHAAENLFLTQSAISSRIKQLEDVVGVRVFTRRRNNILLTPAGERLLPHAENLLASWQLAMQEVGIPKRQNMQLSLGGTSNLWDTFLQSLLPKLAKRFPNLYMRTEINQSQHLIRSLLGGRIDVAAVLDGGAIPAFLNDLLIKSGLPDEFEKLGRKPLHGTSKGF